MKPPSLYALLAVVVIGVSCAQPQSQPPSGSVSSVPSGEPVSVRNGEFAFGGPDFTGWLVAPDGSGLRPISLPDTTAMIGPWAYSPDGTHIAYTGYERGDAGDYAIYVSNADGSDVTDLTSTYLDPAENNQGGPVWSPDSTQIAFWNDSNDSSAQGIYLMNSNGTGIHKIADGGSPAWSPDGESIAFAAAAGHGNDIYSVSIDGSRLTRLTHTSAVEAFPTWSPDGSQIAYIEYTEDEQLWVMDADGGHAHAVTAISNDGMGGFSPDWSPDGTTIAFEVFVGRSWDIYTVHPDGTDLRPSPTALAMRSSPLVTRRLADRVHGEPARLGRHGGQRRNLRCLHVSAGQNRADGRYDRRVGRRRLTGMAATAGRGSGVNILRDAKGDQPIHRWKTARRNALKTGSPSQYERFRNRHSSPASGKR